jgi:hypothetical protein
MEKQRIFSDNNYLFIGRKIPNEFLKTFHELNCLEDGQNKKELDEKNDERRKLERDAFMKIYRVLSEKAHKNAPKSDWNLVRSHNVRKWFNSTLLNAGADSFHVEFFMGHTLDDTRAAYFRANPDKLRNDETIISSISVTDIVFDVYLGKWNYRVIPKVKTWSYFLTIP